MTNGAVDRWSALRRLTAARIGLERAGPSVATSRHLAFQAAHALARDAVASDLDLDRLAADIADLGAEIHRARCACPDLATHLKRPDLGRRLEPESERALVGLESEAAEVVFVLAGGLSARGVADHAPALLRAMMPPLRAAGISIGPIILVERGRVALGDRIGAAVGASLVVMLIGERPGLSAPDSLGAYLTWAPQAGRTDAERNCVSNIRPEGLPIDQAAARLVWLIGAARESRMTGVGLKDFSETPRLAPMAGGALP